MEWVRLDDSKADYGCKYGAIGRGCDGAEIVLLEMPSGTIVITGHMSCSSRADAELQVRQCHKHDRDRVITRKVFDSWKLATE